MNPELIGQTVKVYRNLHRDSWSLMATSGPRKGRVIGYSDTVELAEPRLTVGEASRQRVLREKVRNVHAFVIGRVLAPETLERGELLRVRYNPFRAGCFTDPLGSCVFEGGSALLDAEGALWMDVNPDPTLLLSAAEAAIRQQAARHGIGPEYVSTFLERQRAALTRATERA